ncbi:MAG: low molecular weight phosphotyrosine protein phosphatase [Gammaproteobacteria bacterium]|nr:low molecular weight phosphotyrosine protein phosphatase [Gammaproteobacteria bacterium]
MKKVKVLFVCMGNICRSPTAHGVFRKLVESEGLTDIIVIDSAGTHAYHVGNPPDQRAQQTALYRNLDLSDLRARQTAGDDFERFDYVLAMDEDNYAILQNACPADMEYKLRLFMSFAPELGIREVPDPYYGGDRGFEQVFDMIEAASEGLLDEIRRNL